MHKLLKVHCFNNLNLVQIFIHFVMDLRKIHFISKSTFSSFRVNFLRNSRLDTKKGESLGEGLQKYIWGVGQDFQGLRHGAGVLNSSLRPPFSGNLLESKRMTYSVYRIYLIPLVYLEKSYTLTDIPNLRNLLILSVLFVLFIPCILSNILLSLNRPWRPAQGQEFNDLSYFIYVMSLIKVRERNE